MTIYEIDIKKIREGEIEKIKLGINLLEKALLDLSGRQKNKIDEAGVNYFGSKDFEDNENALRTRILGNCLYPPLEEVKEEELIPYREKINELFKNYSQGIKDYKPKELEAESSKT